MFLTALMPLLSSHNRVVTECRGTRSPRCRCGLWRWHRGGFGVFRLATRGTCRLCSGHRYVSHASASLHDLMSAIHINESAKSWACEREFKTTIRMPVSFHETLQIRCGCKSAREFHVGWSGGNELCALEPHPPSVSGNCGANRLRWGP